jgi:hypothetical protein
MTGEFASFDSEDSDESTEIPSALHFGHLAFYGTTRIGYRHSPWPL